MTEIGNFEELLKNNAQELNRNNIQEPYQNNIQEPYQNNVTVPYQNNIQAHYQNDIAVPYQTDNRGPYQNNISRNDLNQGNANEDLNKNNNPCKTICLLIMFIIFIADIVLMFTALPIIGEEDENDDPYYGSGFTALIFLIFVFPPLIILSLMILCYSCADNYPICKIVLFSILCLFRGLIMITFFNEEKKKVHTFGLVLEILNFIFLICAISLQVILLN